MTTSADHETWREIRLLQVDGDTDLDTCRLGSLPRGSAALNLKAYNSETGQPTWSFRAHLTPEQADLVRAFRRRIGSEVRVRLKAKIPEGLMFPHREVQLDQCQLLLDGETLLLENPDHSRKGTWLWKPDEPRYWTWLYVEQVEAGYRFFWPVNDPPDNPDYLKVDATGSTREEARARAMQQIEQQLAARDAAGEGPEHPAIFSVLATRHDVDRVVVTHACANAQRRSA